MQYISTRGQAPAQSFSEILLGGLAPDGGLYLPERYPQVTGAELDAWRKLSYADLALQILKKFATDIPESDLAELTRKTYTAAIYRNARSAEEAEQITPLCTLEEKDGAKLLLQSLSNGPPLAFKDMAMQLLGNQNKNTQTKQQTEQNKHGATSNKTNSATKNAMRGKEGIRVFMLSPHR